MSRVADLKAMRQASTTTHMVLVDGTKIVDGKVTLSDLPGIGVRKR